MDGGFRDDGHSLPSEASFDTLDHWYLVRLRPGGLTRAKENLTRQGVTSYCPTRLRTQRQRGRLLTAQRPLFPGYLFIQVPPQTISWRSVNGTYGVAQVVCLEPGKPSSVPAGIISALLTSDADGASATCDETAFKPGQDVRVIVGPFVDMMAKVEAVPEKDRIFVLLDMMGRTVRTQLKGADLERL